MNALSLKAIPLSLMAAIFGVQVAGFTISSMTGPAAKPAEGVRAAVNVLGQTTSGRQ